MIVRIVETISYEFDVEESGHEVTNPKAAAIEIRKHFLAMNLMEQAAYSTGVEERHFGVSSENQTDPDYFSEDGLTAEEVEAEL